MQKTAQGLIPSKNPPPYALDSVDKALRLIQLLRDEGSIKLTAAAKLLGVAPSTCHRLFAMLVYRDFAIQDEAKVYHPGPANSAHLLAGDQARTLRETSLQRLEALSGRLEETVSLVVRVGFYIRFLLSVEPTQLLKVSNRQGTIFPAHKGAAGKALLATLQEPELDRLYLGKTAELSGETLAGEELAALKRELVSVRKSGHTINNQGTETGVCAVGVAMKVAGRAPVGIAVGCPSSSSCSLR